jgi:hypothetical protein
MSRRTIQSPGIEIREIDLTQRSAAPIGTSVFIPGFSNQGPTDEVLNVGTFSDFEEIYGKPTNSAERYFYHSVKQVFNSDARVYTSRLPYGVGDGLSDASNKYTALVYPVVAPKTTEFTFSSGGTQLIFTGISDLSAGTGMEVSVELITKDSNGDTNFTTRTLGVTAASVSTISGADIETNLSAVSAQTIVKAVAYSADGISLSGDAVSLSAADYYILGSPTLVELDQAAYHQALDGNLTWSNDAAVGQSKDFSSGQLTATGSISGAGLIVLNKAKTTVNNNFEGYYVGLMDGANNNPATDYDGAVTQYVAASAGSHTPAEFATVPTSRLDYNLSGASISEANSISRTLEEISPFNITGADFVDTISLGVFKVRVTPFSNTDLKLSYFLAEGYTGSLNSYRKIQNENGGERKSFFLEEQDDASPNVKVLVNPYISKHAGDWTSANSEAPKKFVRVHTEKTYTNETAEIMEEFRDQEIGETTNYSKNTGIYSLGAYADTKTISKNLGSIPDKLDRIFNIASNVDQFPIDVSIEAGLGTVWVNQQHSSDTVVKNASAFEDTAFLDLGSPTANTGFYTLNENMNSAGTAISIRDDYRTIFNKFEQFARQTRKDHVFIADVLRNIVVQGDNSKILDDKSKNFSQHVYWPFRHQFGSANSNFAVVYGNWIKTYDSISDKQIWIPFSGNAAGIYARNDANFAPWYAPAGYSRGIVNQANDIAISPTQRQRDQLYRVAINPVTQFPNEGIIVFGQKTLQRKPTAFDRVNVRRLFLDLEKRTRTTLKSFIFEPNTFLTRTKVVNTLTPIFENCKQTEGVYDYLIVCDERNNTSARIENNELIVDIYLKPVRAAEFILVNFYAVNNDVNFEEIVGQ